MSRSLNRPPEPLASPAEDDRGAVTMASAPRRRTSIYLTDFEARRLKHIAAEEGRKVHDLFMEGIAAVLDRRPDPVAETNRLLAAMQTELETARKGAGRWKKGVDPAASKLFWDGVLSRAEDVLRGQGLMTAKAILAGLPESTKKAAADGGSPIDPSSLAHMMTRRADAEKRFEKVGKEFRLREG